jgi:hypothetical protein
MSAPSPPSSPACFMSARLRHNGCDTLMLGFDHDLRRLGFAGNSCQIILEFSAAIDPTALEKRVAELVRQNPILTSRPARGFTPQWKPTRTIPQVRVHEETDDRAQNLFNKPLDIRRGELIRFDLVGNKLIFTWSHALMDAKSAEYFLAVTGDAKLAIPEPGDDWYAQRGNRAGNLRARFRKAWQSLARLETFTPAAPVSLATQRKPAARLMKYHVVSLSSEDSIRVHANAARLCGFLGDTNFHLVAALMELHLLHEQLNCRSASYVVPVPVGLRPKGTRAPLFSNQVTMILHQFFFEQLATVEQAVAAFKARQAGCVRDDQIDAGVTLGQLFRKFPLAIYMRLVKQVLRGEICSLFFGDTGTADPALENFFGVRIENLFHIPAVTFSPGIGVVFNRFREQLRFTVVYVDGALTESEAVTFSNCLRERLLNP